MSGDTAVPAPERAPGFARHPGYRVDILPCPKRVRVLFGGETLADSIGVKTVLETGITPVYYIPKADIRQDLLSATDRGTYCPFKGTASYWSVAAGGKRSENAVWAYEAPFVEVAGLRDHMAFSWGRMDHWYEEDEEVFVHARDPHVRIDVVASKRPVTVRLGGEAVAESGDALFLFETGLPTRYYLPRADVRAGILRPSDLRTACPYKGAASYHAVEIGGEIHRDLVWYYPDPIAEVGRIEDRLCFFNEKVEAILVDGVAQPRPKTKWS